LSNPPSDPRRAAEKAFWHALQERRDQIRDAGLKFDERSHYEFAKGYEAGTLLSGLCAGVGRFKAGRGDPQRLQAMARVMKAGLPTWEDLLIQPGEPWTPYVTPGARRGARAAIADAKACIPFV
jgi:hypothetical protein